MSDGLHRWEPDGYLAMVSEEVPGYAELQDQVVLATAGVIPAVILELGTGTGETARRVLAAHPGARLHGIDSSAEMLAAARAALPATAVTLTRQELQDPLPHGPFGLVVSALAVHHLPGRAKADLFARVAAVLAPGGRFVLGDLIVPADPADVRTEIDGIYDMPSTLAEQLAWLREAGLRSSVAWLSRDLAVIVGVDASVSGHSAPAAGRESVRGSETTRSGHSVRHDRRVLGY
ncbi:MAG TPA: class I SAM-dependent methyltransferase [Solirubrobacteraceae bacterium]|nr:class I SAM-dependent methyltransferase [Solirubrobacteraceae bacterium]